MSRTSVDELNFDIQRTRGKNISQRIQCERSRETYRRNGGWSDGPRCRVQEGAQEQRSAKASLLSGHWEMARKV